MNIRFKFASICDETNNEVSGFILCFDTMDEANEPFRILIKSYEETHIYEKTSIHFTRETECTYSLHLTIHGNDSFEAILKGIDSEYIQQLIDSIKTQGFIFVLTAVALEEHEMILNRGKYISTTRIYVDDKVYESRLGCLKFDLNALKEAIK